MEEKFKCKRNLNTTTLTDHQIPVKKHIASYLPIASVLTSCTKREYKTFLHQKEGR